MKYKRLLIFIVVMLLAYSLMEFRSLKSVRPVENADFALANDNIPTYWALGGAGTGTFQKEPFISRTGRQSIKIVQSSGEFIALYQDIQNLEKHRGRKYSFSCWVNTRNPGAVRLVMGDSKGAVFSNYHSGSGQWEKLTLNGYLPGNEKYLRAHIWLINNATAYIEDADVNFKLPARLFIAPILAVLLVLFLVCAEIPFIRDSSITLLSRLRLPAGGIPSLDMKRIPLYIFLALIFAVAIIIRFTGLHWGVPTPAIPHAVFQCDEEHSMQATASIDLNPKHIDLNPQRGHIEGSFSFYLYNVVAAGLKSIGVISARPHDFKGIDADYSTFLYVGRIISVICDLLSVLVMFLIVRRISGNDFAALLGAFLFAIIPFEAIHSHYMRTHTIANLFVVVMIYVSLFIYKRDDLKLYVLLGLIAGVATATRYPTGVIIAIPLMVLLYRNIFLRAEKWSLSLDSVEKLYSTFVDFRVFLIIVFWFAGFFIADPTLFLDYNAAKPWLAILKENTATREFSLQSLFDLSRIRDYITYLIPYGTAPFLWVLFYLSFIAVLFLKKYYQYTLPLCLFSFLYLYPMAKGYSEPIFIRAVMPLFPVFPILAAVAVTYLLHSLKDRKVIFYSVISFVSLICISSMVYAFAYAVAMSKEDPRIQLYHYFTKAETRKELTIGITPWTLNGFLTRPTLAVLPDTNVKFVKSDNFLDDKLDLDYVLLYSNFWKEDNAAVKAAGIKLLDSKQYTLENVFENRLSVFGIDITYINYFRDPPADLQFPFPKLYLYKKRQI